LKVQRYQEILYTRTQEIGEAAFFLGFDGLQAPSARWNCANLVLFTERLGPEALHVGESKSVDWNEWRALQARRKLEGT
jgi:hypothetical protein